METLADERSYARPLARLAVLIPLARCFRSLRKWLVPCMHLTGPMVVMLGSVSEDVDLMARADHSISVLAAARREVLRRQRSAGSLGNHLALLLNIRGQTE